MSSSSSSQGWSVPSLMGGRAGSISTGPPRMRLGERESMIDDVSAGESVIIAFSPAW